MQPTEVFVFNVGMGQSIFIYPRDNPTYGMLIDCGHQDNFHPIDWLLEKGFIHDKTLSNLTLTNYDHDHFSGIDNLRNKVNIHTVSFSKNLTSQEIANEKEEHTNHLQHIYDIKETYIHPIPGYNPPYTKTLFSLNKEDLSPYDTNNLSQVVFIEHHNTVICISGDIEEIGWKTLLAKEPGMQALLKRTNLFIASHHGRENGYCSDVFGHCSPECIVISDKAVIHETQKDMASVYSTHVVTGIPFNGGIENGHRKVLTTRSDGHLWLRLLPSGNREYRNFNIA